MPLQPQLLRLDASDADVEQLVDARRLENLAEVPAGGDDGHAPVGGAQGADQLDRPGIGRDAVTGDVLPEVAVLAVAQGRAPYRRPAGRRAHPQEA